MLIVSVVLFVATSTVLLAHLYSLPLINGFFFLLIVMLSLSTALGSYSSHDKTPDVLQIIDSEFVDKYGTAAFILSWVTNTWVTTIVSYMAWCVHDTACCSETF